MVERREPTSVTQAQESADKDYSLRVRRYTISMIIRTVCLVLAFVTDGWLRWVMIAGAVVLPYVAVLFANARNDRAIAYEMSEYTPAELRSAASREERTADDAADDEQPETFEGEVVESSAEDSTAGWDSAADEDDQDDGGGEHGGAQR